MTVEIKNPELIEVTNQQPTRTGGNDKLLKLVNGIGYEDKSLHTYIVDAKRILDHESKQLNEIGIERLLCALVIEVLCNGNYGKDN